MSAYQKLAFSIYSRNGSVNQLANEEFLKSSLGLAGLAGGYEATSLLRDAHLYNPILMKSPALVLGSLGSDLGSSIAKSNLSNNSKALISAGGMALGGIGIGRLGYDVANKLREIF